MLAQGESVTAIEVKSGRVKSLKGLTAFVNHVAHAKTLIVGSSSCPLEKFLHGDVALFSASGGDRDGVDGSHTAVAVAKQGLRRFLQLFRLCGKRRNPTRVSPARSRRLPPARFQHGETPDGENRLLEHILKVKKLQKRRRIPFRSSAFTSPQR